MIEKTVLFLLMLLTTPLSLAEDRSASTNYQNAKPSALLIFVERKGKNGNIWYGGSAVLVDADKGYILTARHNILPRTSNSKIMCYFPPASEISRQPHDDQYDQIAEDKQTHCTVVDEDARNDIALLQLEHIPDHVKPISISSSSIAVGDLVHGVLAPHHMINTYYEGYINNIMDELRLNISKEFDADLLFGFSSALAIGASGGMVLNEEGELIGIAIASINVMNSGIAIPVSVILDKFEDLSASIKKQ